MYLPAIRWEFSERSHEIVIVIVISYQYGSIHIKLRSSLFPVPAQPFSEKKIPWFFVGLYLLPPLSE
jgi:hypothetical protein